LAVLGVGEKWLFSATSRGFGNGYEAVRIRVKSRNIFLYELPEGLIYGLMQQATTWHDKSG
jgi:hypothetical protein